MEITDVKTKQDLLHYLIEKGTHFYYHGDITLFTAHIEAAKILLEDD